jgi:ABC-2 type transport system permease protein
VRAVYAFIAQGMRQQMAYKVEGLIGLGSVAIWLTIFVGIWSALLRDDPAALRAQLLYVLGMQLISELNLIPTWELAEKFRQGDVGLELIKPVPLPARTMAGFFGRALFRALRAVPVFLAAWLLLRLPFPGLDRLVLYLCSAILSHLITSGGLFSIALIALWTVQFGEAENIWGILLTLFSGWLVPLHYLPDWAATVARLLPFSGIYYTPAAILSGTLQGGALWQALLLQCFWAVALCSLVALIWRAGSQKLTIQGG